MFMCNCEKSGSKNYRNGYIAQISEHYAFVWWKARSTFAFLNLIFKHIFASLVSNTFFPALFFNRNKKKKIPLMNGEEVDMDLSAME